MISRGLLFRHWSSTASVRIADLNHFSLICTFLFKKCQRNNKYQFCYYLRPRKVESLILIPVIHPRHKSSDVSMAFYAWSSCHIIFSFSSTPLSTDVNTGRRICIQGFPSLRLVLLGIFLWWLTLLSWKLVWSAITSLRDLQQTRSFYVLFIMLMLINLIGYFYKLLVLVVFWYCSFNDCFKVFLVVILLLIN